MTEEIVRFSAWVREIAMTDGSAYFKHGISGKRLDASPEQRAALRRYTRFHAIDSAIARYARDMGLLVAPGEDPLCAPATALGPAESVVRSLWEQSYWQEEIEIERDYQWHGKPIVKMPDDLFLYQELLHRGKENPCVLELGAAPGGSPQFFLDMLSLRKGGYYLGVDEVEWPSPEAKNPWSVQSQVIGDAHARATLERIVDRVGRWGAAGIDLIVIDADKDRRRRVDLLERYASLVAPGGWIVVEDLSLPGHDPHRSEIERRLDQFLLDRPGFGIELAAGRFMCAKSTRACFRRYE